MKLTLRNKVLLTFLGTLLIGMLITIIVNTTIITGFSSNAAEVTFNATRDEELESLDRLASDRALFVDEYFKAVITDVEAMANYAEDVISGQLNITPIESYWADGDIDIRNPSTQGDVVSNYQGEFGFASWEYSTIYAPNVDNPAEFDTFRTSNQQIINLTSALDVIFKSIHASNPNYVWIYAGFEQGGLFRQLPYNDMSWARSENDPEVNTDWDPREEAWYEAAVNADGLNIFLDKDPTSGLVVTASKPIKDASNQLIGVVSLDLPINVVDSAIAGDTILNSGYAFMIDSQNRALIHPRLAETEELFGTSITELELTDEDEIDAFKDKLDLIGSQDDGRLTFDKDGSLWYISYATIGSTGFTVLVVVPEADILESANAIRSQITRTLINRLLVFFLIALLLSAGIVYLASLASNRVVKPIQELTEVTELIASGNLSKNLSSSFQSSREINLLYDTFRGLITALRFGNQDYYAGNINRAMENYQNALQLFTNLNNVTGIGICMNNIGNIHRARGNLKDANEAYRQAVDIGLDLYNSAADDDKEKHIIALSSRYNNLGLLYKDIEQYERGEEFMKEALKYDQMIDNARGFATRYGNLGQIYLAQGDLERAKDAFDESDAIAKSLKSERAVAYSLMNYGLFEKQSANYNTAIEYFLEASEKAEDLDIRVVSSSLQNLKEIYEIQGETELASSIDEKLKASSAASKPKEVTFVLDYSGSMAGRRIRAAVGGMRNIFKDQVTDLDTVSIITFDSVSQIMVNPLLKLGNEKTFMLAFDRLTYPSGATAMYDALGVALRDFMDRPTPDDQWIIALTDGDDNSSTRFHAASVADLARRSVGVNLVIIGVGDLRDQQMLEQICRATDRGKYIHVSSGVGDAITVAFEEVSGMLAEVEVEGFVTDV